MEKAWLCRGSFSVHRGQQTGPCSFLWSARIVWCLHAVCRCGVSVPCYNQCSGSCSAAVALWLVHVGTGICWYCRLPLFCRIVDLLAPLCKLMPIRRISSGTTPLHLHDTVLSQGVQKDALGCLLTAFVCFLVG